MILFLGILAQFCLDSYDPFLAMADHSYYFFYFYFQFLLSSTSVILDEEGSY